MRTHRVVTGVAVLSYMLLIVPAADAQAESGATCVEDPATGLCDDPGAACRVGARKGECTTKTVQIGVLVKKVCQCVVPANPSGGSEQTETKSHATGSIVVPPPGGTVMVAFDVDANWAGQKTTTVLGSDFGGATIESDVLGGSFTISATRRATPGEEHIVDLLLVSASILADSAVIPGLGSTGLNHLSYDFLLGTLNLNDGRVSLDGQARITNDWFGAANPVVAITQHDGFLDLSSGELVIVTSAADSIPPLPQPWTNLGFALPGTAGPPVLAGTGPLLPGSSGSLLLTSARPLSPALLFVSFLATPVPVKCGTLVPFPFVLQLGAVTAPDGSLPLPWAAWPVGVGGLDIWFQFAIVDPLAACGVAFSNALRADVP